ncbi:MAG TPA: alpha-mannosidase [Roseiflexaceae bacterium]|nr:alpha-mannosidase [Roseiflexaceae bacterium]
MSHAIRWTARKIASRLALIEPLVYRQQQTLDAFRYTMLPNSRAAPLVDADVNDSDWTVIEPNSYWGAWRTNFMLRTHFQIPADWAADAAVALYLPIGEAGDFSHPETLAYIDGAPLAACDRNHEEILLPDALRDGQAHLLALHGWTGIGGRHADEPGTQLFMKPCALVVIDQPTRDFIATARVALGIANTLNEDVPARGMLLQALDEAFKLLDLREPFGDGFYESVGPAHAALRAGIEQAGPPLDVEITATGHAHIDVAWLWTLGQTRRKAGRTFSTALRLMEQFPDYHFTQSQPQLYAYLKQDYPELLEQIKARVAEGRWEPIGDMWIEADCNLSGAESLARQFLLGRSFFREHFGAEHSSRVLWLPDVFGYAWALPQLIKEAGLDYFFTIKIGWSQYNRLPYDSFWWQGIDGTRVLTHFSPTPEAGSAFASTYNARATAEDTIGTWTNFMQKDLGKDGATPPLLMAFGFGDGGGGPTRQMLENLRELKHFPATPQVRQGHVRDFFHELEQNFGDRLPTWNGELYLEFHRGTYTTQSRNKRANRKSEFALHDAEFLAAWAALLDNGYEYPAAAFTEAWQLVCLNQFHDIIPGTSITPVYTESQQQYAQIAHMATEARDNALRVIGAAQGGDVLVVNPTSFERRDLAWWPGQLGDGQRLKRANGEAVATQSSADGTWIDAGKLAPLSAVGLVLTRDEGTTTNDEQSNTADQPSSAVIRHSSLSASPTRLENDLLLVELNGDGDITRVFDKTAQREVMPQGAVANQFQAFEDRPLNWDAWDVDIFYDDKMWLADPASSVTVVEEGSLRATIEIKRRILNSDYVQRISLAHDSPRLDIDTTIDWRERHVLLKVAFPVDILSPVATYDIQWGNVQRPTHHNTSWDWARFETCAQKWVDLSEGGYGVSLLNDCKYGHDIRNNVMRISLLRSPTSPDPEADQGQHRFAYSLLPHTGDWSASIAQAYALNDPLIVYQTDDGRRTIDDEQQHAPASLVNVDQPNVVIETIKRAEDGNGMIVRLYESQRQRGPVTLHASFPLAGAWRTNLLEDDKEQLETSDNNVRFDITPYQIVTLRLVPA